ncbi:MAG: hypothetical protein WBB19_05985 [Desulforhopalus sp.]
MNFKLTGYLIVGCMLLLGGCGLTEGVVQKEPKSFLWFTGNVEDSIVYIDDITPFKLNSQGSSANAGSENDAGRRSTIHYEISPGKHSIVVTKLGKEVVNRNVLLGNGITKEIQIP